MNHSSLECMTLDTHTMWRRQSLALRLLHFQLTSDTLTCIFALCSRQDQIFPEHTPDFSFWNILGHPLCLLGLGTHCISFCCGVLTKKPTANIYLGLCCAVGAPYLLIARPAVLIGLAFADCSWHPCAAQADLCRYGVLSARLPVMHQTRKPNTHNFTTRHCIALPLQGY